MSEFVVVTRKDNKAKQIINLDAVERVDVNPGVPLPALDSTEAITEAHLGNSIIHFIFSEKSTTGIETDSVQVVETADDMLEILDAKGAMAASDKLADRRAKLIEQIKADREKERSAQKADAAKADQAAAAEQMKQAKVAEKAEKKAAKKAAKPRAAKAPKERKARKAKAAK